jgi:phospholipase/lecithinase/hemolysin
MLPAVASESLQAHAKGKAFAFYGDSLSDVGLLKKRKLFGCIPMDLLEASLQYSPYGRFNEFLNWTDYLVAAIQGKNPTPDDFANGTRFTNAAVGGATAATYSPCQKRNVLKSYACHFLNPDEAQEALLGQVLDTLGHEEKATLDSKRESNTLHNTVVFLWIGANDFVTIDDSISAACGDTGNHLRDQAPDHIASAVKTFAAKVRAHGVERIYLLNLPDFSKTPWVSTFARDFRKQCLIEATVALLVSAVAGAAAGFVTQLSLGKKGMLGMLGVALFLMSLYFFYMAGQADTIQKKLTDSLKTNQPKANSKLAAAAAQYGANVIDVATVWSTFFALIEDNAAVVAQEYEWLREFSKKFDVKSLTSMDIDARRTYKEKAQQVAVLGAEQYISQQPEGSIPVFWDDMHPTTFLQYVIAGAIGRVLANPPPVPTPTQGEATGEARNPLQQQPTTVI